MSAIGKSLFIGIFVAILVGPGNGLRALTSIKKWFKVACIAEHLKETDHYICDKHGYIHCLPGWSNEYKDCKVPVCTQNCTEHGNCTAPNTCTCDVGWTGADCSKCICLPGCVNGYCQLPFECICEEGFHGMLCDKPKCKEGCAHGHCTMPGECICHPGWTGENCDICIKLPGCSKHGQCTKPMECVCKDGYEGNFCGVPKCREGCHPQYGFCDRPNECWCKPGWTGDNCTVCLPYPGCTNGGCEQPWECNCKPGYHGKLCDLVGEGEETTTSGSTYGVASAHHSVSRSQFDFPNADSGFFDIKTSWEHPKQKRHNEEMNPEDGLSNIIMDQLAITEEAKMTQESTSEATPPSSPEPLFSEPTIAVEQFPAEFPIVNE